MVDHTQLSCCKGSRARKRHRLDAPDVYASGFLDGEMMDFTHLLPRCAYIDMPLRILPIPALAKV